MNQSKLIPRNFPRFSLNPLQWDEEQTTIICCWPLYMCGRGLGKKPVYTLMGPSEPQKGLTGHHSPPNIMPLKVMKGLFKDHYTPMEASKSIEAPQGPVEDVYTLIKLSKALEFSVRNISTHWYPPEIQRAQWKTSRVISSSLELQRARWETFKHIQIPLSSAYVNASRFNSYWAFWSSRGLDGRPPNSHHCAHMEVSHQFDHTFLLSLHLQCSFFWKCGCFGRMNPLLFGAAENIGDILFETWCKL